MDDVEQPQIYQINVRGLLPQSWSEYFAGAVIDVKIAQDGTCITQLTQVVTDQAALQGILNRLYDLHLTLISCNQITRSSGSAPHGA